MIRYKTYDEDTRTQEMWVDSTMIYYTKMVENDDNTGSLYVTFKNGATYCYKEVTLEDYILFMGGGNDASQGKTLNKIIKPKYSVEKCENVSIDSLEQRLSDLLTFERDDYNIIANTYFIYGPDSITESEYYDNYYPVISDILQDNSDAYFIFSNDTVGLLSQKYLLDIFNVDPSHITLYYIMDTTTGISEKITNRIGGFNNIVERDEEMINKSFQDIAFIHSGEEDSQTAKNILKRFILK